MIKIMRGFARRLDIGGCRRDRTRARTGETLLLQDQFQLGASGQSARYAERQCSLDDGEHHARSGQTRLAAGLSRRGPFRVPTFQIATVECIDARAPTVRMMIRL